MRGLAASATQRLSQKTSSTSCCIVPSLMTCSTPITTCSRHRVATSDRDNPPNNVDQVCTALLMLDQCWFCLEYNCQSHHVRPQGFASSLPKITEDPIFGRGGGEYFARLIWIQRLCGTCKSTADTCRPVFHCAQLETRRADGDDVSGDQRWPVACLNFRQLAPQHRYRSAHQELVGCCCDRIFSVADPSGSSHLWRDPFTSVGTTPTSLACVWQSVCVCVNTHFICDMVMPPALAATYCQHMVS